MKTNLPISVDFDQPDEREDGREDSMWYTYGNGHDLVTSVTNGERTINIYADGEMDIRVYTRTENGFEKAGASATAKTSPNTGSRTTTIFGVSVSWTATQTSTGPTPKAITSTSSTTRGLICTNTKTAHTLTVCLAFSQKQ